jgi:serine/threonine protein kinase
MDLLGPSLFVLKNFVGGRMSGPTVLLLAEALLLRLEALHAAQFIHRDIKPENILMGIEPTSQTVSMRSGSSRYVEDIEVRGGNSTDVIHSLFIRCTGISNRLWTIEALPRSRDFGPPSFSKEGQVSRNSSICLS